VFAAVHGTRELWRGVGALDPAHCTLARIAPRRHCWGLLGERARGRLVGHEFAMMITLLSVARRSCFTPLKE
jgi:hypothetical protein